MFDWLDGAVGDTSEVITASRRLARELQLQHAQRKQARGETVWRSATILSLQDWLVRLLADCQDPTSIPVQITAQQSRVLWERCLRREIADPLLNIRMLSRQSRETWKRMREWQVPVNECQRQARNRDQALFARAAQSYCSILERENWIDETSLADLAAREIEAGHCRIPERLTLAGFDRITPQVRAFIDAIKKAGGRIRSATTPALESSVSICSAENSDAELRAAGAWAREQLTNSPDLRLAIIVTQLEQDAQRSLRLIKEGMIPGWQNADGQQNAVINVSYGKKLTEYPAVAIALLALRWLFDDLSTLDVSRLLLTTMFGADSSDERVRLELRIRQQPDQSWSPERLLSEIAYWGSDHGSGEHLNRIRRFAERRNQMPKRQSPADWVALFDETLRELQWPGVDTLQSAEFQLVNRWRELLNDVARLDLVSASMDQSEALGRLSSIAGEIIFQPESTAAVLQVMGPLEAAGLQFDKLWVSGMSAANWPPSGRPMSLISRDLQRDFAMPDATPAESLQYAQRVIARLLTSAADVVFSYPLSQSDAQQTPSELLREHRVDEAGAVVDPGWHARQLCHAVATVAVSDRVPAMQAGETISGGAATVQRHFVEPFTAFVTGRLDVRALQPIVTGLPASIRGSLIHSALHQLYKDCPASDAIKAWDDAAIVQRIQRSVHAAFRPHERNADAVLRRLLLLERARVAQLLRAVIALDSSREDFRIAHVEHEIAAQIGDLSLRLRIDRVDVDAAGELLILDYKTGAPKRLLDRDKNPNDLQLVVYAYALKESIGGIGLLNVDSRAVELDGAGRHLTPKLDWNSTLSGWEEQVEIAARQIAAGDVRVNALQTTQAARSFGLLSRFQEHARE